MKDDTRHKYCPRCTANYHRTYQGNYCRYCGEKLIWMALSFVYPPHAIPLRKGKHLKSEHQDAVGGLAVGHGKCAYPTCKCQKFTWVGWVTEK